MLNKNKIFLNFELGLRGGGVIVSSPINDENFDDSKSSKRKVLLTPIGNILGPSPSVIFGNKIQKFLFCDDSGDVIHRRFEILLSYHRTARGILPIPEII